MVMALSMQGTMLYIRRRIDPKSSEALLFITTKGSPRNESVRCIPMATELLEKERKKSGRK